MIVTSRSNPAIKRVRALSRRSARAQTGLFLAEGIHLVGEAVEAGTDVELVIVAPDLLRSPAGWRMLDELKATGVPVLEVDPDVFTSISLKEGPQGIAVVAHQRWMSLEDARPGEGVGWVALEAVQDPGNLGSILRTGDAVGASGLVILRPAADPYDPTAVRASMGAVFRQQLARAGLPALREWATRSGMPIVGASDAVLEDYATVRYQTPLVLLMGSEQKGLSDEALALVDTLVRIPMAGHVDSLNLSVATAVVLYQIFNRERQP
ncbi:MAG: TrmH family RNA methyltransferase [Chloroflexota bacterium]